MQKRRINTRGTRCNATCPNCPNPNVNNGIDIPTVSGFDGIKDIDFILKELERPFYTGIAISGGEPTLYMDKLVEWIAKIKNKFPKLYIWSHIKDIKVTEENLKRLVKAGMDELRLDLAADNYLRKC